jgi:hypothetical protein
MQVILTEKFASKIANTYLMAKRARRVEQWYEFYSRAIVHEERLKRQIRKIFRAQKMEALNNLNTDYFFDVDSWNDKIADILEKAFLEIVVSEGNANLRQLTKSVKQGIGVAFDVENPYVEEMTIGRSLKLAPEINEETQRIVRNTLIEGHIAGEGMPILRDRVKTVFDEMLDWRALRIARTETIWSSCAASEEAYVQSEVVEKKAWLCAQSEATCEDCLAMDGREADLRQPFDVTGIGIDLSYYDGIIQHPVLHPHCRCCLIPIT